jgi:Ca2+-transporting ATPase
MFFALVAAVLALILADRSFSTSLRDALLRGNPTFRNIFAAIMAMAALILTVPPLQRLLQFTPLSPEQLLSVGMTGIALLLLLERIKRLGPRS